MKFSVLLLGLCLAAISCSLAQSTDDPAAAPKKHRIDVWLEAAMEKDSSTAGMVQATAKAGEMWDAELNTLYKKLVAQLTPPQVTALKAAQRKWIEQRDAELTFVAEFYGAADGTMWRVVAAGEAMEMVKARALVLQGYLDNLGNM